MTRAACRIIDGYGFRPQRAGTSLLGKGFGLGVSTVGTESESRYICIRAGAYHHTSSAPFHSGLVEPVECAVYAASYRSKHPADLSAIAYYELAFRQETQNARK